MGDKSGPTKPKNQIGKLNSRDEQRKTEQGSLSEGR